MDNSINPTTGTAIPGTQAAANAADAASNAANAKNAAKATTLANQQQMSGLQGFAFLVMLFLGMKNEHNDPSIADNDTLETISSALGLDFSSVQSTISNVREGNISVYEATANTFKNIDFANADFSRAEKTLKDYNGLNGLPPVEDANFLKAVDVVLKLEGGWNPNEPDGGVANFGINSNANPDVDVRNLTQNAAVQLYKTRYWDKIEGIDNLDQRTALVAFDLAVNSGVGRANKMLRESGGDVAKLMEMREAFYDRLIEKNPAKYAQYEQGWDARMKHLETALRTMPAAERQAVASLTAQHAETMAQGGVAESKPLEPATNAFARMQNDGGVDQVAAANMPAKNDPVYEIPALAARTPAIGANV